MMLLMKFKALITDLDYTLVFLPIDWEKLREEVRKILKTSHPLKPLASSIPVAAKGDKRLIEKAFKYIEEVEFRASETVKYNRELVDFFKKLKDRGLKIGLVTLQGLRPARNTLRKLGILEFFDVIVTREDSLSRKEQILIALRKLNVKASETIFVGDSVTDAKAGKELGIYTVIIGNKASGGQNLENIIELNEQI